MSSLYHDRPSNQDDSSWPADSDTRFWTARTAHDDLREAAAAFGEQMACASEIGRLPSDDEFFVWQNGIYRDDEPAWDEAPEMPDSAFYEPEPDDRQWWAAERDQPPIDPQHVLVRRTARELAEGERREQAILEASEAERTLLASRTAYLATLAPERREVYRAAMGVPELGEPAPISGGSPDEVLYELTYEQERLTVRRNGKVVYYSRDDRDAEGELIRLVMSEARIGAEIHIRLFWGEPAKAGKGGAL